ncbi:PAS domain protein, partial [mine drainage metagenome]
MPDQDAQPINADMHWLEQLPAGVILIVGERLRYANAEALRLIGASAPREVLGRSVQDFIHPLDLARVLARIRRAERGEIGNPPTEFRVYACDGSLRVLAMNSTPLRMEESWAALATFMDLSAHAEMDARLRETDDNFQRMMNTMQDVFYRTDADGITRYVCPAVRNVLGYSAEEIVGLPAAMFYPDPVEREPLLAAIRRDGFVHDFPGRMRRKDGRIIDIAISTQILRDEQGNYAGVEGIWRDITERKRMERE